MAAARFKNLFPKLKMTSAKRPKTIEGRVAQVEAELRDVRGVLRDLIEALERRLTIDLDGDRAIGHVSAGRGLPKTVRLNPLATRQRSRLETKSAPLPPNIP